ncbi:phytanoyl-CoA dioxygenase family protein [Marinicella meishanensis]|uniref:phytanoyl-CoA dioxygenase family protein n=1 Tax=Marinicella meishanensis TaxID=2873263 RepID=UPI001CC1571A|nr:phytanoyl-CoA dioxygenase family protein [Marinicella sp. NBU2979]
MQLSPTEIEQFKQDGYLVFRQLIDMELLNEIRNQTKNHLQLRLPPFELEAELGYPKAPQSVEDEGGLTIRRLLLAFSRDASFREWGKNRMVKAILQQLLDSEEIKLVQSHHNCIMTKQPEYSSKTMWHRDVRYWKFSDSELINSWLAMGSETNENGCLKVIPGSHRMALSAGMVDEELFLKVDHPDAQPWLEQAIDVTLQAGDVLLFHAAIFHAANHNRTDQAKFSLVYSYHGSATQPLAGSKSTTFEEISV